MPIHYNKFAEDGRIACETLLSQAVAENDDLVVASLAVFGHEAGTKEEIDSE